MKKLLLILIFWFSGASPCNSQGSWSVIPNVPNNGRYDDIYFINDSTGFVSQSSFVYKTSDKGTTWNQISVLDTFQYYVRSIEFINDTIGFAGLLESAFPLIGNLYKTTDGGYSWTLLQNMQISTGDGICGMAHYGNRLIAVGTYLGPPWFYRSDDFGLSWMKVDLSNLMEGLVDCYMISNDTILVSGIADSSNNYNASIVKSNDGGLTWNRVYLSNTSYLGYCWKIFFRPGGLGVASVESNDPVLIIARTVDYGDSWSTVTVDTSTFFNQLGGIALMNDTLGWVCDQSQLGTWETWDGGLTWNMINSPVDHGDRLVKVDSLTVLAAGSTIYRYSAVTVSIDEPHNVTVRNQHELIIYPNPGNNIVTIDAIAVNNTFGILDLTATTGKMVKRITRQPFAKGKNSFHISIADLPAGMYTAVWHNNERRVSKTFTVVH